MNPQVKEALAILCFMCLCVVLGLWCGCDRPERIRTAVTVSAYAQALDDCRALGKDAGSYDVYEACAKQADAKYGRKEPGK